MAIKKPQPYERSFDFFWEAYPKKVNKKRAKEIWCGKIKPSRELFKQIIGHIYSMSKTREWSKQGGTFIPHPTTYLNGERWEDEIPKPFYKRILNLD